MNKKILHLTLKKKWFDLIAAGKKPVEYREIKPYLTKRLFNEFKKCKYFDEIHFRNGYNLKNPFMIVEHKGTNISNFESKPHYAIHLGKILEIKQWKQ